ncbi:MAG: hypothetical protein AAGC55_11670 [Myxococcota bacterium]
MGLIESLLRRLGYVRLQTYDLAMTSDGRVVPAHRTGPLSEHWRAGDGRPLPLAAPDDSLLVPVRIALPAPASNPAMTDLDRVALDHDDWYWNNSEVARAMSGRASRAPSAPLGTPVGPERARSPAAVDPDVDEDTAWEQAIAAARARDRHLSIEMSADMTAPESPSARIAHRLPRDRAATRPESFQSREPAAPPATFDTHPYISLAPSSGLAMADPEASLAEASLAESPIAEVPLAEPPVPGPISDDTAQCLAAPPPGHPGLRENCDFDLDDPSDDSIDAGYDDLDHTLAEPIPAPSQQITTTMPIWQPVLSEPERPQPGQGPHEPVPLATRSLRITARHDQRKALAKLIALSKPRTRITRTRQRIQLDPQVTEPSG